MTNQETPTFKWLDENGEPYCPGKQACTMECDESCPIVANVMGYEAFEKGETEEAKELFKKAIVATPDNKFGSAWSNLAATYMKLGMARDAHESFKNAYCINQDKASAYAGLAVSYAALKEYDKALEWCDKYAAKFGEEDIAKLRGKILKKQAASDEQ